MPGKKRPSKQRATLKWLEKQNRINKNHAAQIHAEIWLEKEKQEYLIRKQKPKEAR